MLAGRHPLPCRDEISARATAADGAAYVDPKIVAFARNRIDAWRPQPHSATLIVRARPAKGWEVATPSSNLASAEQRLKALRQQRSAARAANALHNETLDRRLFDAEAAVISASRHAGDRPRRLTEGLDEVRTDRMTMTRTMQVYDGEAAWIDRREQQWQRALRSANRPRSGFVGWLFGRSHA